MSTSPTSTYRQSAGHNATPVRLVVMLYEQLVHDLQRALAAMERNDIEARVREIDHALIVIGQLQGTLDHEQGPEVARNLDRFYDVLRASLLEAHIKVSAPILRKQISWSCAPPGWRWNAACKVGRRIWRTSPPWRKHRNPYQGAVDAESG